MAYAIKTEKMYSLVFAKVIEVLRTPGEGAITIIRMVSDFKFAVLNSIETAFPEGTSRGCWFHFGQVSSCVFVYYCKKFYFLLALFNLIKAIYRKVTTEGLKEAYAARPNVQKIIKMQIALALLPADKALAGFMVLYNEHFCNFVFVSSIH